LFIAIYNPLIPLSILRYKQEQKPADVRGILSNYSFR